MKYLYFHWQIYCNAENRSLIVPRKIIPETFVLFQVFKNHCHVPNPDEEPKGLFWIGLYPFLIKFKNQEKELDLK